MTKTPPPSRRTDAAQTRKHAETDSPKPKRGKALRVLLVLLLLIAAAAAALYFILCKPPAALFLPYQAGAEVHTRDGVYSFLLIGQRDGLTDTLMAALLDTKKGTLNLVSIPRDTITANARRTPKINGAYLQAKGGDEGIRQLLSETAQLIGYVPDNYVMVDMAAFAELVDALGGVEFDVPENMSLPAEGIQLTKGPQLLDGDHALQLVRYRSYTKSAGVGLNDFGRMEIQHRFLRATAEKARGQLSLSLVKQLGALAAEHGKTNMKSGEFFWLALTFWRIGTDNLHFETLPTQSVRYGDSRIANVYYEQPDADKALALVNAYLNPYTTEITADMVSYRILVR